MKPLRYVLIGCGRVAEKHLKAALFCGPDIEVAALADISLDAPRSLCLACGLSRKKTKAITFYQDYRQMLDEQRPDLVAVTTGSGSHFEIAMAAIAAGAHVIVEKPLTLSLSEADELLTAAQKQKVKVCVGHIYRFFPLARILQDDLAKGAFGQVLYGRVSVFWGHDQAYYDQAAWRGAWASDGGALMNQSIHALDLMTWLLGSPVREVTGRIGLLTHRIEAEDIGLAILRLDNGGFCQVAGTTCTHPGRHAASFEIIGTEGEIRCGLVQGKPSFQVVDRRGRFVTSRYLRRFIHEQWRQGGVRSFFELRNPHSFLYKDLIQAIKDGLEPLADGLSGRQAVELVLAIYRSAREGKTIVLPLNDFSILDMTGFCAEERM